MIYVLSALAACAYVPYLWVGDSIGKWAAAAALSAALCRWEAVPIIAGIWLAAVDYDAAAKYTILALAFSFGLGLADPRRLIVGFGIGIGLNSLIAIGQLFGLDWFVQAAKPAGTFLNKNFLAEAAALCVVAACMYRVWWVAVISTPALVLPFGRAALAATLVGLIASVASTWRWRVCLLIAGGLLVPFVSLNSGTLAERVAIWNEALQHLTVWGHGIGSWSSASIDTATVRSQYMHNDWLQLVYELGVFSLPVFVLIASTLGGFTLALIIIGSFGFPLHEPATALISAAMLGSLCSVRVDAFYERCRVALRNRLGSRITGRHQVGSGLVPVGSADQTRAGSLVHEHASKS